MSEQEKCRHGGDEWKCTLCEIGRFLSGEGFTKTASWREPAIVVEINCGNTYEQWVRQEDVK